MKALLARLANGARLSVAEAEAAFDQIMGGGASPAQIAGLLMALRVRGETVAELTGAVRAMRQRMLPVPDAADAIDVCGTGGDQLGTLNVSTAVTFVTAGAGVRVAKHGNRSASSRSGGADVLAALGVRLDPPLARLPEILNEAGCVFLFAPRHHPALGTIAPVRAELGVRTIFNLMGPLANPAAVRRQLTGVFDPRWARPFAEVLGALGTTKSWIVHSFGLDELSLAADNEIIIQSASDISQVCLRAGDLGLAEAPVADIIGGDAAENAACLLDLLRNTTPSGQVAGRRLRAYRDTVLLNSAAALVISGQTDDLTTALTTARRALDSGAALDALDRLRVASEIDDE